MATGASENPAALSGAPIAVMDCEACSVTGQVRLYYDGEAMGWVRYNRLLFGTYRVRTEPCRPCRGEGIVDVEIDPDGAAG